MAAGYTELFLEQGSSFSMSVTLDDVSGAAYNLVNYVATSQMRKSYYSSTAAATFTVSTGNSPELGIITIGLDAANTANIYPGRYVYDVYVENEGDENPERVRVLEGIVNVSPQVTKKTGML
jgi:hypothetical protein